MSQKYEKPVIRNLDNLQNAQGYCTGTGSGAHGASLPNCTSGQAAIGAYCGFGGGPSDNSSYPACKVGTTPGFSGCNEGGGNATNCSTGSLPS